MCSGLTGSNDDISGCLSGACSIKLKAELTTTNPSNTPVLYDWEVSWNVEAVPPDTTPPTITAHSPTETTNVPVNTNISVTFDEAMDTLSAQNAFSISPSVADYSFNWIGNEMIFIPSSNLNYETLYTVTIGTGAQDLASPPNTLEIPYSWTFTTETEPVTDPLFIDLDLEAKPIQGNRPITVSICNPGEPISSSIYSITFTTDNNDDLSLDLSGFTGNRDNPYDIFLEMPNYLRKKIQAPNLIDSIAEKTLKIGNLDNSDQVINSSDWSVMLSKWGSADPNADFNEDGIVNTIDFSFMNRNWGISGD